MSVRVSKGGRDTREPANQWIVTEKQICRSIRQFMGKFPWNKHYVFDENERTISLLVTMCQLQTQTFTVYVEKDSQSHAGSI